jgi:hypothetical protein
MSRAQQLKQQIAELSGMVESFRTGRGYHPDAWAGADMRRGQDADRDFRNQERNAGLENEPGNNVAVYINGKEWKVLAGCGAPADSMAERHYMSKMRAWAEKKSAATGKKWEVSPTGAPPTAESMNEGRMPSSVIKNKQRNASMSDKDFHSAHKDKSEDELKAMAWRHGYGKDSSHYVNKHKKGSQEVAENFDAEYDDEAGMAHNSLGTIHRATVGLAKVISEGDNLPEWCQEKLSLAEDYLVTVWDYIQSEKGLSESDVKEWKKSHKAPIKPRNFVAKNASASGAGAHKDKKKAEKQGETKHKKKPELAESATYDRRLNALLEMKVLTSKIKAVRK